MGFAIHQHESTRGICVPSLLEPLLLPPHPILPGCHRALTLGSLHRIHQTPMGSFEKSFFCVFPSLPPANASPFLAHIPGGCTTLMSPVFLCFVNSFLFSLNLFVYVYFERNFTLRCDIYTSLRINVYKPFEILGAEARRLCCLRLGEMP